MGKSKIQKAVNSNLRVFIIDDSIEQAKNLSDDLQSLEAIGEVTTFHNCCDATLALLEEEPDVIFLDIEMPEHSGLEFFDSIKNHMKIKTKVVFYSAFSQYIIDALRKSAFDFLLKPYKLGELKTIVNRILDEPLLAEQPTSLVPQMGKRKIAVQTVSSLLLVTVEEVLHFQYSRTQRAWVITLTNGFTHRLHQNTTAEDIVNLHPSFARVNQGWIVNLTYLSSIENNTQRCNFCSPYEDIEIYASRRNFSKLKEKFEMI